jgi:hypothetical protein
MRVIAIMLGCAAIAAASSGCSRGSYDCAGGQPDGNGGCTRDAFNIGMQPVPPLSLRRCMAELLPAYRKAGQTRTSALASCRDRNADWYYLNLTYNGTHAAYVGCTATGVDRHGRTVLRPWPVPLTLVSSGAPPRTHLFMHPGQNIHLYHLSSNAPGPVANYRVVLCHTSANAPL